jgi:hypothetical protein
MRSYKPSSLAHQLAAAAFSVLATAALVALLAMPSGEALATAAHAASNGASKASAQVVQLPKVVIRAPRSGVQANNASRNPVAQARG